MTTVEEKYRTLFDSIDEGFCIIQMLYDTDGKACDWRFLEVNPAFEKHNGLTNATGKTIRELTPHIEPKWIEIYGRVAQSGESNRFIESSAALQRVFDLYAFRIGEPGEHKVAVLFTNITERRRVEEDLRLSREKLTRELEDAKRLQQISSLLIEEDHVTGLYDQLLDTAMAIMDADFASLQILDDKSNELHLLGMRGFHPESATFWKKVTTETGSLCGMALQKGERKIITDVTAEAAFHNTESLKYFHLSGIVAVQSTPLVSREGRIVGMLSTHWRQVHAPGERELRLLDILARQAADFFERRRNKEELRQSEARLRALIENLPGAVFVVDRELRYRLAQGEALLEAGFQPENFVGKTIYEVLTPELAADYEPYYRMALGGESFEYEHDAHGHTYITRGTPLRDAEGQVFAALASSYDISARKRAEAELQRARDELEVRVAQRTAELSQINEELRRAEAARAELLRQLVSAAEEERRRIAHELHDQMGQQIAALLLGLKAMEGAARGRKQVTEIAERLHNIVSDIDQEVVRLSLQLRPAALDDLGLPLALTQHLESWARNSGVEPNLITRGLKERLPIEIETTLYRVAQEALTNIAKHAAAKNVSLVLERRAGEVRMVIEDDGVGFDTKNKRHPTQAQRQLGIIGMRERVALWKGTFGIESQPGHGTKISVRIPLTLP